MVLVTPLTVTDWNPAILPLESEFGAYTSSILLLASRFVIPLWGFVSKPKRSEVTIVHQLKSKPQAQNLFWR